MIREKAKKNMAEQIILRADEDYIEFDTYLRTIGAKRIFLVCGNSISQLQINTYFNTLSSRMGIKVIRFSNFRPNPLYESVVEGVGLFRQTESDLIVAVGGGSAIDVAKCIKLYSNMNKEQNYLEQEIQDSPLKLVAVPTTAGTGSEATRFAVIYCNGEKQSVCDDSCLPEAVLMDASTLNTLPEYQRKVTMLDALCHGIEAFWSVNSTKESRGFSVMAIRKLLANMENYLKNEASGNQAMLEAANLAGRAINIAQTTAGHAMSYKLTSLYGIAHGHAVALCVSSLWPYMISHTSKCVDPRGAEYLDRIFLELAHVMGGENAYEAVTKFQNILERLCLPGIKAQAEDYKVLKKSVNPIRLKNNPVSLNLKNIDNFYHQILGVADEKAI